VPKSRDKWVGFLEGQSKFIYNRGIFPKRERALIRREGGYRLEGLRKRSREDETVRHADSFPPKLDLTKKKFSS